MAMDRDEMLAAAMEYVAREGLADFSLRACAAAIGTSHRMLGYHFGTKDQFLATIVDAVAARMRGVIDAFIAARGAREEPLSSADIDQALSLLLLENDDVRFAPLLAEATYLIARHPGRYEGDASTYEEIVALWTPQLVALFELGDLPEAQRHARARLAVSVMVGLSIDYLGSRDASAYVAAYREWIRLATGV